MDGIMNVSYKTAAVTSLLVGLSIVGESSNLDLVNSIALARLRAYDSSSLGGSENNYNQTYTPVTSYTMNSVIRDYFKALIGDINSEKCDRVERILLRACVSLSDIEQRVALALELLNGVPPAKISISAVDQADVLSSVSLVIRLPLDRDTIAEKNMSLAGLQIEKGISLLSAFDVTFGRVFA
jgi:hypothetical protein